MPKLPLPRLPGPWGGPLNLPPRMRRASMMAVRAKTYPKYRAEFQHAAGEPMAPFAMLPQKHGPRNNAIPAMRALYETKACLEQMASAGRAGDVPVHPGVTAPYPSPAGSGHPPDASVPEVPYGDEVRGGKDPVLDLQEKGRRMKETPETEFGPGGRQQLVQRLGIEQLAALTDATYWMK